MILSIPHTSRKELKSKLDRKEPFFLIDALPPEYFRTSHLPGALNLTAGLAKTSATKMVSDKNTEIIVYCMSAA